MPRDSQREKVYRAEKVLEKGEIKYETVQECEQFLRKVFSDPWFKKQWPKKMAFRVYDGRRRRSACGWGSIYTCYMKLPRHARTNWIILHELSHGLQPPNTAWHGPEFCSIYVRLVHQFVGEQVFHELTRSFREHRVRYLWLSLGSQVGRQGSHNPPRAGSTPAPATKFQG
jgi:putative metallohydrolase (TIGR04338 family)